MGAGQGEINHCSGVLALALRNLRCDQHPSCSDLQVTGSELRHVCAVRTERLSRIPPGAVLQGQVSEAASCGWG